MHPLKQDLAVHYVLPIAEQKLYCTHERALQTGHLFLSLFHYALEIHTWQRATS